MVDCGGHVVAALRLMKWRDSVDSQTWPRIHIYSRAGPQACWYSRTMEHAWLTTVATSSPSTRASTKYLSARNCTPVCGQPLSCSIDCCSATTSSGRRSFRVSPSIATASLCAGTVTYFCMTFARPLSAEYAASGLTVLAAIAIPKSPSTGTARWGRCTCGLRTGWRSS